MRQKTKSVQLTMAVVMVLTGLLFFPVTYSQSKPQPSNVPDLITERKSGVLQATSANQKLSSHYTGLFNLLYWQPLETFTGYKLTRREIPGGKLIPLNKGNPITIVHSCAELKRFIDSGSVKWNSLYNVLTAQAVAQKFREQYAKELRADSLLMVTKTKQLQQNIPLKSAKTTLSSVAMYEALQNLSLGKNPLCEMLSKGLSAKQRDAFYAMALAELQIRLAAGLAFADTAVTVNTRYTYYLYGIGKESKEKFLDSTIIQTGKFILPAAPKNILATGGDDKVLILWDRNESAYNYRVQRAPFGSASFKTIHTERILYDVKFDIKGDTLHPARPGYMDYRRFDTTTGQPSSHSVNGTTIFGPANGTVYQYRAASIDILDRVGSYSPADSALPQDKTPPKTPDGLKVSVYNAITLSIQIDKVRFDARGHVEQSPTHTYLFFRSDNQQLLDSLSLLVPGSPLLCHSTTVSTVVPPNSISWTDSDTSLRLPYGEKDIWYRVVCSDNKGNMSTPSAVAAGRLPDKTAPGHTKLIKIKGYDAHIHIDWDTNPEPDVAGYHIYRGSCDYGNTKNSGKSCDFLLVGAVTKSQAFKRFKETGYVFYNDSTVPTASPLCYAYWVRAYDASGNEYNGERDCPNPGDYLCGRLIDRTAPPYPIITKVESRSNKVTLTWKASPIQDLRAFRIYRSDKENDPPKLIGAVLNNGTVLPDTFVGKEPDCGEIPASASSVVSVVTFTDTTARPQAQYWYRVAALDFIGNMSKRDSLVSIPAINTFTYTNALPETPKIISITGTTTGCGMTVQWTPAFDSTKCTGFIVFRSDKSANTGRQVSKVVRGNSFNDQTVIKGTKYWYSIQVIDILGMVSKPSDKFEVSY